VSAAQRALPPQLPGSGYFEPSRRWERLFFATSLALSTIAVCAEAASRVLDPQPDCGIVRVETSRPQVKHRSQVVVADAESVHQYLELALRSGQIERSARLSRVVIEELPELHRQGFQ
jgi:hypothetical protein